MLEGIRNRGVEEAGGCDRRDFGGVAGGRRRPSGAGDPSGTGRSGLRLCPGGTFRRAGHHRSARRAFGPDGADRKHLGAFLVDDQLVAEVVDAPGGTLHRLDINPPVGIAASSIWSIAVAIGLVSMVVMIIVLARGEILQAVRCQRVTFRCRLWRGWRPWESISFRDCWPSTSCSAVPPGIWCGSP